MAEPIHVDIWSDVQCPWCYIGKRRFETAVAGFDGEVEVEYHSFHLAPDTPIDYDGTPEQYLSERRGIPPEQVRGMVEQVSRLAAAEGLDYDYAHMHQTNTGPAHELLHFAKANGKQAELKEALLKAYFVDGGHVGKTEQLLDLAVSVGLDRDAAAEALASGSYAADVQADLDQATAYGIQGVPFYVFNGQYGVSGAQEAAVFRQVLDQVGADSAGAAK